MELLVKNVFISHVEHVRGGEDEVGVFADSAAFAGGGVAVVACCVESGQVVGGEVAELEEELGVGWDSVPELPESESPAEPESSAESENPPVSENPPAPENPAD